MAKVYSWGLFTSEEKPAGVSDTPKFKFIADKIFRLYVPDDLNILEGSIYYLQVNEPITIHPGEYEAFEMDGGDLLFVGQDKFPACTDEDDLKALAKTGIIRFI